MRYLLCIGSSYVGVDLSHEMVVEARRRFPDLIFRDEEAAEFLRRQSGRCFASVAMLWSLHHMTDPGEVASEVSRVVQHQGKLLLVVQTANRLRRQDHRARYEGAPETSWCEWSVRKFFPDFDFTITPFNANGRRMSFLSTQGLARYLEWESRQGWARTRSDYLICQGVRR